MGGWLAVAERSVVVRLRAEIADFKRQMDEAARSTDKIPESAKRADTALGQMTQSARTNREAWDRAGTTMLAFGTATLAGLGLASKAAIDWESAWTGVLKTVDGTSAQLTGLEDDLREMARTLPATHQEIAAVAEAAGALGVATEDVSAFTRVMIDLGETTNLTADEAATAIAQLMNVMQTAPDEVDNLGSALVALGNNGASTEREIVLMAQRIAGAGEIVGMTEADVLGLANALASVGIEVEAGGSAISRVITDIASDVADGGDDLQTWARVAGMTAQDFAAAWEADPARALASFTSGLGRMQAAGEDVFGVLDELGMSDVRVSRALLTMATSGDLVTESLDMSADAWAENIALLAEAEKRYDTAAARLDVAKGSINDAAITLGEVFLPAIADAADGVADFAGWVAGLPAPVQQAAGGVAALAGGVGVLGGGILLLVPRIAETITHFRNLGTTAQSTIKGLAGMAAIASVAVTLLKVADAAQTATVSSEELLNRLVDLEDQGAKVDSLFSDIGQGWADAPMREFLDPSDLDDFRRSLEKLNEPSIGFVDWLNDIAGVDGGLRQFEIRLGDVGAELGGIARTDLPRATAMFNQFVDAAGGGEEAVRLLLDAMPEYEDALYSVANAQGLTLDETSLLRAATGDLGLVQTDAAAAATVLGDAALYAGESTEAATAALEEWRGMVADADASFVDLSGAYQSVIDANLAYAQSTADSTASSTDSWEDYYDGFSVSKEAYVAELEAQVAAQEAWETNMLEITRRVNEGMTGEMREAGNAMLDELYELGPEGAAMVALLYSMSEPEFNRVVDLWRNQGTYAVQEFVSQVEGYRQPVITLQVDDDPAYAAIARIRREASRTIYVNMAGQDVGFYSGSRGNTIGRATGGLLPGAPSPRDNMVIAAASGEYVVNAAQTARHLPLLEAINSGSLPGYAAGGVVDRGIPAYYTSSSTGTTRTYAAAAAAGVGGGGDVNIGVLSLNANDVREFVDLADFAGSIRRLARQKAGMR